MSAVTRPQFLRAAAGVVLAALGLPAAAAARRSAPSRLPAEVTFEGAPIVPAGSGGSLWTFRVVAIDDGSPPRYLWYRNGKLEHEGPTLVLTR